MGVREIILEEIIADPAIRIPTETIEEFSAELAQTDPGYQAASAKADDKQNFCSSDFLPSDCYSFRIRCSIRNRSAVEVRKPISFHPQPTIDRSGHTLF